MLSGYNGFKLRYFPKMVPAFPCRYRGRVAAVEGEIRNAVSAADKEAQYDEKAKRLLGNKIILAHILVKTIDEFRGMNPKGLTLYFMCG